MIAKHHHWINASLLVVLFLWFLTLGVLLYSKIEGSIYPVVTPLVINNIAAFDDEWTQISGIFTKIRSCRPIDIRWYQGERTIDGRPNRIPLPVRFVNQDGEIQQIGEALPGQVEITQHLQVGASPEVIQNNSFAYVYHFCYNRQLWETQSLFYDSRLYAQNRDTDS